MTYIKYVKYTRVKAVCVQPVEKLLRGECRILCKITVMDIRAQISGVVFCVRV